MSDQISDPFLTGEFDLLGEMMEDLRDAGLDQQFDPHGDTDVIKHTDVDYHKILDGLTDAESYETCKPCPNDWCNWTSRRSWTDGKIKVYRCNACKKLTVTIENTPTNKPACADLNGDEWPSTIVSVPCGTYLEIAPNVTSQCFHFIHVNKMNAKEAAFRNTHAVDEFKIPVASAQQPVTETRCLATMFYLLNSIRKSKDEHSYLYDMPKLAKDLVRDLQEWCINLAVVDIRRGNPDKYSSTVSWNELLDKAKVTTGALIAPLYRVIPPGISSQRFPGEYEYRIAIFDERPIYFGTYQYDLSLPAKKMKDPENLARKICAL